MSCSWILEDGGEAGVGSVGAVLKLLVGGGVGPARDAGGPAPVLGW